MLALRCRAAIAVQGSSADPRVVESELLGGTAEPAVLDDDDLAEQSAIQKLSVQDAALRTLRLARQAGAKRGGPSRAPAVAAKKPSAPKAARPAVAERAGPADTYEQKLAAACADFKGSDGRQHFKERLARNFERQGVEVRCPP